ncbi:leukocyte-associated immunoglobulin-like receptor 1 isoform X2 [Arvicola amphibius]|uniref:leukocyte-associated immunoglobulin-like receptor 1 isoform X2 n=1 Tax=Arvicola amphibius TaxID=1047088 RepID=UPI0018E3E036|nr:leukocyte-associated immunoglobulin-like receptor 1 isoform X2 [Arvicola amphibius]
MSLHSATVVALESLPSPSILADPGPEIPQGHFVKIVCTSPREYDTLRLEKHGKEIMNKNDLPSQKPAIFQLGPVNEDTAGSYQCLYQKGPMWSQRSEILELKVTSEDVTHTSDPVPGVTSDTSWLKTNNLYILIGVAVVFLLCLLLFLLFCFHSHHQKKQGLPKSKSQEHRPQKRLSLVINGLESTPDIVTDDLLPEDKRTETLIPDAGGLLEVTYAQLDHHALTQKTAGDVTPRSTETMTESSTYAAIIRR